MFDDLDKEPDEIFEMFERMFKSFESMPSEDESEGSYFYGFSITQKPDGKPIIREFGNVKPAGKVVERSDVRESIVDTVYEPKGNLVKVIVEMPGVDLEDVTIKLNQSSVHVAAAKGDRKYYSKIPLDVVVIPEVIKKTFNNGILEITLKAKNPRRRIKKKKEE